MTSVAARHTESLTATTPTKRISWILVIWCLAVTLLLSSAFRDVRWSYVDAANNLSAAADHRSWGEVLSDSLTKSAEYRPLLDLGTKLAYQIVGLNLGTYKVIVGLEFALILAALVLLFRPVGWRRGIAAMLALSIAVGLHTSRILFLFNPLNAYSTSMLIVLGITVLALSSRLRGRVEWVLLPLTLATLLWLEVGVLIVLVVAVAWLMRAPGTTWRSVAASVAGLAIYLVARLGFAPSLGMTSPDTGLGFSVISPQESAALFAHAPWLFWLYNVGATLMSVLASEPRAGVFRFVSSLLRGNTPAWMWLHVLSSIATTTIVFAALVGIRSRPHRDRVIAAMGAALVVGGSVLGFLYTRDRIGLPIGFGYAMLVYVALSAVLEQQTRWRTAAVGALVAILCVCWSIRTGEMYIALRETAWDYHLEWTRPEALAPESERPIVARMRASALKRVPPNGHHDPLWTYVLFERRFTPDPVPEQ